jgi:hypothetical protein
MVHNGLHVRIILISQFFQNAVKAGKVDFLIDFVINAQNGALAAQILAQMARESDFRFQSVLGNIFLYDTQMDIIPPGIT